MRILKMFPDSINERYIAEICSVLEDGGLIIYPTDTAYAIGCDATNSRAIEKICKIKKIDYKKNHLSILCSDISQAAGYALIDNVAFSILKRYLPGPYTFILPASPTLPKLFKGRRQVGIRIPQNNIPVAIAKQLGKPLLTTTALSENTDSQSIILPEELADIYEPSGVSLTVDGGDGVVEQSTIVDLSDSREPVIIRQGKGDFKE